jgi:hypothetical protein
MKAEHDYRAHTEMSLKEEVNRAWDTDELTAKQIHALRIEVARRGLSWSVPQWTP